MELVAIENKVKEILDCWATGEFLLKGYVFDFKVVKT